MSDEPDYSRLCRLIHDSLSPYTDDSMLPSSLTKEVEKSLLIDLSQVYTKIKQWTEDFKYDSDSDSDSDSKNEIVEKPITNAEGSILTCSHSDNRHCLPEIIGDLMALLTVENPYIQHLAGNTFVAISEFVVASETGWDEFMHLMCLCLKLATNNSLLPYFESMTMESKDSEYDFPVPIVLLKCKVKIANLSTAAAIVRVLRNVLKLLKQDCGDQNLKVYRDAICTVISDIMHDVLNKVCTVRRGESVKGSSRSVLTCLKSSQPKSVNIFQANLLQLFCSLVDNNNLIESGAGSADNPIIISTISNLIPEFLAWCMGEAESSDNIHMLHYFRHKILMLLIRLSSRIHLDCSVHSSWMNLIHEYFENLLTQPITSPESEHHDSLEGSPFQLVALDWKRKLVSPTHLQRLAVFLFLRCSFSVINMKENTGEQCACASSYLTVDRNTDSECCRRSRGLLELHRWLQGHLSVDIFEDSDMYSKRCVSFAICFLQLYMHEDDILFEMLLQLFCVPVYPDQCIVGEASLEGENNIFSLVSDIFNPIRMFHFFLSEIHYDHQVLLDYLISKDSGASSAEYLLRSLRIICDSWNLFVEFPGTGKALGHSDQKRRKVSAGSFDLKGLSSTSVICDGTPSSAKLKCRKGCAYVSNHGIIKRLSFEDAKDCLSSLQMSIESLSHKGLFPYNPRVLLQRLTRFQELCQTSISG